MSAKTPRAAAAETPKAPAVTAAAPKAEQKPAEAAKAEAKPVAAPKAEAAKAPEAKPAPKAEAKPAAKVEPKSEAKPEAKPAAKAEAKPEPKAEPKVEAKPAPKAETKPAAPVAAAKAAPAPAKAAPAPKAEAKPEPQPAAPAPAAAKAAAPVAKAPAAAPRSPFAFGGIDFPQPQLVPFNREGVDAFMQAGNVVAKGVEDLSRALTAYVQETLSLSVATGKAMLGATTLKELVDLQSSFAKSSFDHFMSNSTRLSELSMKVANEAMQPIGNRLTAVLGRGRPAA
ncbi:MAG TPA: phasin family protein [Alphaproteobacteria bacterium]|nr:phasin family protein [Alphaproteobacteria bacterium]